MKTLYLIPARGGSKGIPGKNIKKFNGKPLVYYSIDLAREFADDKDICVSTDSQDIAETVRTYGLELPFIRPAEFATDTASGYDVIKHAIQFYEGKGVQYDRIVLLQPTSPLRTAKHLKDSLELYSNDVDMVVSVQEMYNPIYLCYNEDENGFLKKAAENTFTRRQDMPKVYKYNGAIYIMKVDSLKKMSLSEFSKIRKYVMDDTDSVDIDNPLDWEIAELIYNKKIKGE
ncbi:MAG: acylneuraminate cytidylyltransferase family protein [Sporocytophaga sp.]|uniref:acylneuraminate cytidylyltransferase family protein n=1 Tax=Sporocytophaga sp. TaxID=2231183 RepID=UPI001B04896C|nr:acylneuraminate cytidylyltransferase family protein [Sporocytophaga sp.]MBO9700874.1 acylneuraminate cytidylyltransferase family protein [Sporocytophaga sp.]